MESVIQLDNQVNLRAGKALKRIGQLPRHLLLPFADGWRRIPIVERPSRSWGAFAMPDRARPAPYLAERLAEAFAYPWSGRKDGFETKFTVLVF
jgi:hypothetical protein